MTIKNCVICNKAFDARGIAKSCSKECSKEHKREYDATQRNKKSEFVKQPFDELRFLNALIVGAKAEHLTINEEKVDRFVAIFANLSAKERQIEIYKFMKYPAFKTAWDEPSAESVAELKELEKRKAKIKKLILHEKQLIEERLTGLTIGLSLSFISF
jgi:hypothetical protein